jgi:hypothetical protein
MRAQKFGFILKPNFSYFYFIFICFVNKLLIKDYLIFIFFYQTTFK